MRRLGARLERVEAAATRRGLMKTVTLGDLLLRVANEDAESYPLVKASVAQLREQSDADILEFPPFIQFLERVVEVVEQEHDARSGHARPATSRSR